MKVLVCMRSAEVGERVAVMALDMNPSIPVEVIDAENFAVDWENPENHPAMVITELECPLGRTELVRSLHEMLPNTIILLLKYLGRPVLWEDEIVALKRVLPFYMGGVTSKVIHELRNIVFDALKIPGWPKVYERRTK